MAGAIPVWLFRPINKHLLATTQGFFHSDPSDRSFACRDNSLLDVIAQQVPHCKNARNGCLIFIIYFEATSCAGLEAGPEGNR